MRKKEFEQILFSRNWSEVGRALDENPGALRFMIGWLTTTDENRLGVILDGFQIAAKVFDEERTRDLGRRLLWMLNEESGNNCPNAALAMASLAMVHPDYIEPHIPVLKVHANDPSEQMQKPVRKALTIINKHVKEHKK